jgi:hypothetical protein
LADFPEVALGSLGLGCHGVDGFLSCFVVPVDAGVVFELLAMEEEGT